MARVKCMIRVNYRKVIAKPFLLQTGFIKSVPYLMSAVSDLPKQGTQVKLLPNLISLSQKSSLLFKKILIILLQCPFLTRNTC